MTENLYSFITWLRAAAGKHLLVALLLLLSSQAGYAQTVTTWTGNVTTDWFTDGNWTAGVPTATLDAIIPASVPNYPVVPSGTASVKNLTLNSGARLTQSGGTLNLTGNLTSNGTLAATGGTVATSGSATQTLGGSSPLAFQNLTVGSAGATLATTTSFQGVLVLTGSLATNGQSLTLLSSVSGSVGNDGLVVNNGGTVTGAVTVQRAINGTLNSGLGYRHYSSPVANTTVADLTTPGFTPVVNPAYNTSDTPGAVRPYPTVYGYNQSRLTLNNDQSPFNKGFFSPAALSTPLTVGQGYTVNIAASEKVDFVGTLNNGAMMMNLPSNRNTYPDGGWQLVGNPYPAPLDYSRVAPVDRIGLDGAIFVYSSTSQYSGQYRAYINGVGGNPVVSSGQGFFVRVAIGQTAGTLTFRNSQRLTLKNSTAFQRTAAETRPLVQLTLQGTSSSTSDDAYVYFENGASEDFDSQYDAVKLANTTGLNLSASITGQQLAIDGLPELGNTQRVIPLAVGVPTPGTYSFTAAQLLNLAATPVYLRDVQLGTLTDLRLTPSYQFTVTNASALLTGRFELVFSPQQALATVPPALAQQVALYPNPAKKAAFVELPASLGRQAVTATLVDALGRVVRTVVLPAQGALAHQLDLHELPIGIYALRLSTSAGVVVKKLVVE